VLRGEHDGVRLPRGVASIDADDNDHFTDVQ
jgi:hypothetical protein